MTLQDVLKCTKYTHRDMDWCVKNNAQTKYGQSMDLSVRFGNTLQGYLGEEALAKHFGYETVYRTYDKNANDVLGYEVRTVKYQFAIMPTHHDDKPAMYVCVSLDAQTNIATIKGWSDLDRCNVRTKNWRTDWRYPCFGMPEHQLWPINTLPATPELIAHQKQDA